MSGRPGYVLGDLGMFWETWVCSGRPGYVLGMLIYIPVSSQCWQVSKLHSSDTLLIMNTCTYTYTYTCTYIRRHAHTLN